VVHLEEVGAEPVVEQNIETEQLKAPRARILADPPTSLVGVL
jgi:hypothetical protein